MVLFPLHTGDFISESAPDYARCRVGYSIALICGPQIWNRHNWQRNVRSDDLVCEEYNSTHTIPFLGELLQKSSVDFLFLNGTYFQPINRMTETKAESLGQAVGCSSLGFIQFKNVAFTASLPIFLKKAAQNPKLKNVDMSIGIGEVNEETIDNLINSTPNGLPFELILPSQIIFGASTVGSLADCRTVLSENDRLQKKLTAHFGDKVKFGRQ